LEDGEFADKGGGSQRDRLIFLEVDFKYLETCIALIVTYFNQASAGLQDVEEDLITDLARHVKEMVCHGC